MVASTLDHLTQSQCFVLTRDDEHDFPRIHDGLDADGQSPARDEGEIVIEESAVVEDCLVR